MSVGIDPKYLQATIYLYPSASAARDGVSVGGSSFILGVIVVRESHRKRGISKAITERLLASFERPLFATTSNEHMERTLSQAGFVRSGYSWKSHKNEDLHLWITPMRLSSGERAEAI